MGTCAKVGEVSHLVEGDNGVFGKVVYKLNLVWLVLHKLEGFFSGKCEAFHLRVFLDDFLHLGFKLFENVGSEGYVGIKVIVESVVDSGTYCELDLGIKSLYSCRENMGSCVTENVRAVLVFKGEKLNLCVGVDGSCEVGNYAVDSAGENIAGDKLSGAGSIISCYGRIELHFFSGKFYGKHNEYLRF